jgi:hypothetical protein
MNGALRSIYSPGEVNYELQLIKQNMEDIRQANKEKLQSFGAIAKSGLTAWQRYQGTKIKERMLGSDDAVLNPDYSGGNIFQRMFFSPEKAVLTGDDARLVGEGGEWISSVKLGDTDVPLPAYEKDPSIFERLGKSIDYGWDQAKSYIKPSDTVKSPTNIDSFEGRFGLPTGPPVKLDDMDAATDIGNDYYPGINTGEGVNLGGIAKGAGTAMNVANLIKNPPKTQQQQALAGVDIATDIASYAIPGLGMAKTAWNLGKLFV